jgi:hypothetical protein
MVQKDLLAFSGSINGGVPTMSFVTQTFHETGTPIPEPASLTLLALGVVGITVVRRWRYGTADIAAIASARVLRAQPTVVRL